MYNKDGAFGRSTVVNAPYKDDSGFQLFGLGSAGWHFCNDLYRIERNAGGEQFLIIVTISGKGILKTKSTTELSAGSVAVIPPYLPVRYFTPPGGEWEFYWMHPFSGGLSHSFLSKMTRNRLVCFDTRKNERAELYTCAADILKALSELPANQIEFSRLLSGFFHQIAELHQASLRQDDSQLSLTQQIIKYLNKNLSEPISLKDISKKLYISPGHIIRTLKKETGMSPHAYLLELRIKRAESLLRYSGDNIQEIAKKTSFSSASHFAFRFNLSRGMTPTEYRQGARPG